MTSLLEDIEMINSTSAAPLLLDNSNQTVNLNLIVEVPLWFYILICAGTVTFSLCCACWCFCATWKIRQEANKDYDAYHHGPKAEEKSRKPKTEVDVIAKSVRSIKKNRSEKSAKNHDGRHEGHEDAEQGERRSGRSGKSRGSRKSSRRPDGGRDDLLFRVNENDPTGYFKMVARKIFF